MTLPAKPAPTMTTSWLIGRPSVRRCGRLTVMRRSARGGGERDRGTRAGHSVVAGTGSRRDAGSPSSDEVPAVRPQVDETGLAACSHRPCATVRRGRCERDAAGGPGDCPVTLSHWPSALALAGGTPDRDGPVAVDPGLGRRPAAAARP